MMLEVSSVMFRNLSFQPIVMLPSSVGKKTGCTGPSIRRATFTVFLAAYILNTVQGDDSTESVGSKFAELLFPCGAFKSDTGCGALNFGAIMHNPTNCDDERCVYFAGLFGIGYTCGPCGGTIQTNVPNLSPFTSPQQPPLPSPQSPIPLLPSPVATPLSPVPLIPSPVAPTPQSPVPPLPSPVASTPQSPVRPPPTPISPPQAKPGNFQVTLDLQVDESYKSYFRQGAARWETVIREDIPDIDMSKVNAPKPPSKGCIYPSVIDDLWICAYQDYIDGEGKTVGFAGVTLRRTGSKLPAAGYVKFEKVDMEIGIKAGWLLNLMTHENGHNLGLGTEWSCPSSSTSNSVRANAEFKAISGCSFNIPTEGNAFGQSSTNCLHWRKTGCLEKELMTNVIGVDSKLSRISIGALEDMGYGVDYSAADEFTKSNLGSNCRCNVRNLSAEMKIGDEQFKDHRRGLSLAGHKTAIAQGRSFLQTLESPLDSREHTVHGEEVYYTGGDVVFVYYMENDQIYGVHVEPE